MERIKGDLEVINKNNIGIVMTKENKGNMSIVSVLDLEGEVMTDYVFKNINLNYKNKYLNWQNLDCCGGWAYDKEELINQLIEDKKPFGNVVLSNRFDTHLLPLIEDCRKQGLKVFEIEHWNKKCREFVIMKEGSLDKYIDLDKVLKDYYTLGLPKLSSELYCDLKDFLCMDMDIYINKDNVFEYDFANPKYTIELIFTGLLLGYPIESTADRIGL